MRWFRSRGRGLSLRIVVVVGREQRRELDLRLLDVAPFFSRPIMRSQLLRGCAKRIPPRHQHWLHRHRREHIRRLPDFGSDKTLGSHSDDRERLPVQEYRLTDRAQRHRRIASARSHG